MENINPSFFQKMLKKYTYTQKINLVLFIIGFLISLLTFVLLSKMVSEIRFTQLESIGVKYQKIIYQLLSDITTYKVKANSDFSDSVLKNYKSKIDLQFQSLINYHSDISKKLTSNPSVFIATDTELLPQNIFNQWTELFSPINSLDLEKKEDGYSNVIDRLQYLLSNIMDASNLSFDQDIETHYFSNNTLNSLPEELDLISRILSLNLNSSNLSKNRTNLIQFSTLISSSTLITKHGIEKALSQNKENLSNDIQNHMIDYLNTVELFLAYIKNHLIENRENENNFIEKEFIALGISSLEKNNKLWDLIANKIDQDLTQRIYELRRNRLIISTLIILSIALAFGIVYIVITETNRFFQASHKAILKFSNGDLSSRIPPSYDATFEKNREVLNELGDRIETLIDQLQQAGIQLTTTTTEIAAAARHQEGTVCQQESTVNEILTAVGEISARAKEFAKTMNEISSSAEETSSLASAGKKGLVQMEEAMRLMMESSKSIALKLAVLNEKASNITSVITTITKVADQTNMLSFNASIEAEKAGEHGKSFAVIAREIRRLADQTANATLDIEQMVSEIMSAVTEGVTGVGRFSEDIHHGAIDVSKISEQMSSIINQVQQQTRSYEYVNKGMQAQSLGAEQINESIMQLSDAAQETTISIRQFHTAIEQLTIASKEMQTFVAKMKLGQSNFFA